MSKRRRGLERFLHQFDKDEALRQRYASEPGKVAEDYRMSGEELGVLQSDDIVTIYAWGVHPLLIRNYAGFRRLDYYGMLKERGYNPD